MAKVKNFFKKAGRWLKNHAPTKRRLIQIYAALLYNAHIKGFVTGSIYKGATKYACVPGFNCYSCPGAVGACPLGALQNSLAQSNERTPYYIIGILALFGLIFARTICGFLCPVGLSQELLYKIPTPKLKKSRYTRILSYLKYVFLVIFVITIPVITRDFPAFCKFICPAGTFGGAGGLIINPANAELYNSLKFLFSWKFIVLVIVIVASIFVFRFFCRFICPLGAIYGFFNKFALIGVKLDESSCVDCGMCLNTCKMDIKHVGDHECINCGECISVCPTKAISWKGSQIVLKAVNAGLTPPDESQMVNLLNPACTAAVAAEVESGSEFTEDTADSGFIQAVEKTAAGQSGILKAELEVKAYKTKIKKRAFWLEFAAWAVALAVLATALVYYNFIYKQPEADNVIGVGMVFIDPDKDDIVLDRVYNTAGTRGENGEQTTVNISFHGLYGKVTVLNFWYTDCGPCVKELPLFEKIKEEYGDRLNMIIVHSDNGMSKRAVQEFIDSEDMSNKTGSWTDWQLIFTHDNAQVNLYTTLGGKGGFPRTVIIADDGVITYAGDNAISEELLRAKIEEALNKQN